MMLPDVNVIGIFFSRLLGETETRGPRVSDAWYAALGIG
jgi:hypothetical protein